MTATPPPNGAAAAAVQAAPATAAPKRAVVSPLVLLLLAERAALPSGRDDEFVACILKGYTGMRWGELVGLEAKFARPSAIRIEWQLYELDTGELLRCPPKDDSYRTIDAPGWLANLVAEHIARTSPRPCPCHGRIYVFRGRGTESPGANLSDVARRAGVAAGTASAVFNHPDRVSAATLARVAAAIADLGYVRGGAKTTSAPHWRRNGFATWLFTPAASGWYPKKAPRPARPVVLAGPWPGVPARGRKAHERADACWLPIAAELTPHGLRHSHRSHMEELRTEKVLMDERMGHIDGSISARYTHVTPPMRRRLMANLTRQWERSLAARRELSPRSPVSVLDALLQRG